MENIIFSGHQCTLGPEVSLAKTTDVYTLSLGQAKPVWPGSQNVSSCMEQLTIGCFISSHISSELNLSKKTASKKAASKMSWSL